MADAMGDGTPDRIEASDELGGSVPDCIEDIEELDKSVNANLLSDASHVSHASPQVFTHKQELDDDEAQPEICENCSLEKSPIWYCSYCDSTFCEECWVRTTPHRPGRAPPDGLPHEKANPKVVKRLRNSLNPSPDAQGRRLLKVEDDPTIWFGVSGGQKNTLVFDYHERFSAIIAESDTDQHRCRHPLLVSFVGEIGSGKSTLIKLLMEQRACRQPFQHYNIPCPILRPRGGFIQSSSNVHLYSDPSTFSTDKPMLYAESEGLSGVDRSFVAPQYSQEQSSRSGQKTQGEKHAHEQNMTQGGVKETDSFHNEIPKSQKVLQWTEKHEMHSREDAVAALFPRMLYTLSDVITFVVHSSPTSFIGAVFSLLIPWGCASEEPINQPVLPHAVIVFNARDPASDIKLWDIEAATDLLMSKDAQTIHQTAAFRELCAWWAARGRNIETVKDLLECYYSSVTVVHLPHGGRYMLLDEQLEKLYMVITKRCSESWYLKRQSRMLANSEDMDQHFKYAFELYSRDITTAFHSELLTKNFALRTNLGAQILALSARLRAKFQNPTTIFRLLGPMVASCILLDCSRRKLIEPVEEIFEDEFLGSCDFALNEFCTTIWPCMFVDKFGDRCANVMVRHAKGHQNDKGKIIGPGEYQSSFTFDSYGEEWLHILRDSITSFQKPVSGQMPQQNSGTGWAIEATHRKNALEFYRSAGGAQRFTSQSACLFCLLGLAEHALPCGHIFCTACVEAYSSPYEKSSTSYELSACLLHHDKSSFSTPVHIRLKPPLAGLRILSLDGGVIRTLVSLETLRQIQLELGGTIHIQDFFDLIIGSSTGGVVALGLGLEGWSIDRCRTNVLDIMNKAILPGNTQPHSKTYQTNVLEELLKAYFMDHRLFGSIGGGCKVAVTSTTEFAGQTVIFANYNRPEQQQANYRLVRPDDEEKDLKVWEAARATTAMPMFFKPFTNPRTMETYLDGGLNHINPAMVAAQESKLLWPDARKRPPDIFLSLGTGHYNAERELENSPQFGHDQHTTSRFRNLSGGIEALIKRASDSLNAELMWNKFIKGMDEASSSARFIRVNPKIEHTFPKWDDKSQVATMQKEIEEIFSTSQSKLQVKIIARQLVASSFYFERLGPHKVHNAGMTLEGRIQCRFATGSENLRSLGRYLRGCQQYTFEPYFNCVREPDGTSAQEIRLTNGILHKMINLGKFDLAPFSLPLTSDQSVTMYLFLADFNIAPPHERTRFAISGFPRTFSGDYFAIEDSLQTRDEQPETSIEVPSQTSDQLKFWDQGSVLSGQSETLIGGTVDIGGGTIHLVSDVSDDESLESTSVRTHLTTPRELDAKTFIAQFLASEICSGGLENVDKAEFGTTGRRLLKTFYLSLINNATTELERQSIRLLKSRQGRRRISYEIADIISAGLKASGEMKDASEQIRMRKERLERWARGYEHVPYAPTPVHLSTADGDENAIAGVVNDGRDAERPPQLKVSPESQNGEDSRTVQDISEEDEGSRSDSDKNSRSNDSDQDDLPYLKDMEAFFRSSGSFPELLTGLRLILLPQHLRRIVLSTSVDNIWLSDQQEVSVCNHLKGFIEDFTRLDWNWWPLEARMRTLKDDECRLVYRCSCGVRLWKEITRNEANILRLLFQSQLLNVQLPSRCSTSQTLSSKTSRFISALISQLPLSSAGQRYTPSNQAGTSNDASQGSQAPAHGQPSLPQVQGQQSGAVASHPNTAIPRPFTPPVKSWVIFGVKGSRPVLEIEHIAIDDKTNDSRFYRELRDHYRRNRGRFRLWFSFWRLGYCDVMKFKRIAPEWIIGHCKELPQAADYKYNPRPPAPEALNPPISRHEFSMHLHGCDQPCRWKRFHSCMPHLATSSAIECVPKKISPFDTGSKNQTDIYAWGLEARYEISAAYVAFYHIVILAVPFAFWGWWLAMHPGDLQNASIPVTVVIAMLSLFWASNGILTQGRHFGEIAT